MRFLLTLLALIAGFATPGMTLATARAQVAGAEQVETAPTLAPAIVAVRSALPQSRATVAPSHTEIAPVADCSHGAGCSIALSDRPRE